MRKPYFAWPLATALLLVILSCSSLRAGEEIAIYQGDILQEVIELVIEYHPLLQSQREIVRQIELLTVPRGFLEAKLKLTGGAGLQVDEDTHEAYFAPTAGLELEIPIIDPSRQREIVEKRFSLIKQQEEARQKYIQLKNSVVSQLLGQVGKLIQLENEREKVLQLNGFLDENLLTLRKQVEAGVAKQSDLWVLRERIINLRIRIDNLSTQMSTLKREMAITLGGEEWPTLSKMLDQLTLQSLL